MAEFPHCDPLVLHAPGACIYCDKRPAAQQARVAAGVNFTGEGPDPATAVRPLETIERWYGNTPKTLEDLAEEEAYWRNLRG